MRAHLVLAPLPRRARRARWAAARIALAEGLAASAALAGAPRDLPCADWPRDLDGAPAVVGGWHASVADTAGLAAAVVAPFAVAVDVEALDRPRIEAARARFAASGELALLGSDERASVLALWTAKEALLKLARTGIADLGRCPLVARAGELFHLCHRGRAHAVRVIVHGAHVVACASVPFADVELHTAVATP